MSSVPADEAGAGSTVNATTREIGGTLGVAIIGSITSSYHLSHVKTLVDGIDADHERLLLPVREDRRDDREGRGLDGRREDTHQRPRHEDPCLVGGDRTDHRRQP